MSTKKETARILLGNIMAQLTALVDTMEDETLPRYLAKAARSMVRANFEELMSALNKGETDERRDK